MHVGILPEICFAGWAQKFPDFMSVFGGKSVWGPVTVEVHD